MRELEPRVQKLESFSNTLAGELKQLNATLGKIEVAIEKQNEIRMDISLLGQKFDSHLKVEEDTHKVLSSRLEDLEGDRKKLAWTVILIVIAALSATILK